MNVDEAMTVETSEQTAQDALVALQSEVEHLRALMTPPVDPLQVVALGQARLLIASLTEKVERLRAIEHRARFTFTEPLVHPAAEAAAQRILGEG